MREFRDRHQRTREFFLHRFEQVRRHLLTDQPLSENRRLLIGSYFTQDTRWNRRPCSTRRWSGTPTSRACPPGRAGSSSACGPPARGTSRRSRSAPGVIDAENRIRMDEPTRFVTAPELVPNALYDKTLFHRKLTELGINGPLTDQVMAALGDQFTLDELERTLRRTSCGRTGPGSASSSRSPTPCSMLAKANYEIRFSPSMHVSERIIFPSSPTETNGIEDARFVQFTHDDGRVRYYATYTAYDGRVTLPQMLETEDFLHFQVEHPERPGGPEQGLRPVPPHGQRASTRCSRGRTTRTST